MIGYLLKHCGLCLWDRTPKDDNHAYTCPLRMTGWRY